MDALFAAVRRACPGPLWNQGTSLARSHKVYLISRDAEEVICRVEGPKGAGLTVRVYPEDQEWDCDCPSTAGACEHVAAATIALRQAEQSGEPLSSVSDQGQIAYLFSSCKPTLSLQRVLESQGQRQAIQGSLQPFLKGLGKSAVLSEADRRADAILDPPKKGALPPNQLRPLFSVLAESLTYLDDKKVTLSTAEILPKATLRNHPKGDGVVLVLKPDPRIDAVVGAGLVRCGDRVHLLGELALCGLHLEKLPLAKHFKPAAIPSLMAKTLPALKKRFPVQIKTDKLPGQTRALRPELHFRIQRRDDTLEVRPDLVYGNPPVARIVNKQLESLHGPLPKRDEAKEVQLRMSLRDRFSMVPAKTVYLHGSPALSFIEALASFEGSIEGFDPRKRKLRLLPKVQVHKDRVELFFHAQDPQGGELQAVDTAKVLEAWKAGQTQLMLGNARLASLDSGWFNEHRGLLDSMAQRGHTRQSLAQVDPVEALALARILKGLNQPAPPQLAKLNTLLSDFSSIPKASLPQGFRGTLRSYQQEGVNWLRFLASAGMGGLLADDMGLGKTIQTLASMQGRALVVCPTSVMFNWRREASRFLPEHTLCLFHGPKRALDPNADITITSYALMRQDPKIQAQSWDCVVLDEAQAIKNPESQTSQAAFALQAASRIALSGTPIENRLDELWSIMHFCNPGLLGGRKAFANDYATPIAQGSEKAARALHKKISPILLRRKKSQVAKELPPRTEDVLYCELSPEERRCYEALRAQTQESLSGDLNGAGSSHFSMLEKLLRLRQAACHRGLLPNQRATSSSKIERLIESLHTLIAAGHRALVFSQWTQMLDAIEAQLKVHEIDSSRIDGSTRDRESVVQGFSDPQGPPVMLISLKAGGTGLNLTAADHVFLMDPWWNPATEAQAADRAHRIGQTRSVMVYRLVARDTVEDKILALQAQKRAVAEQAMQGALTQVQLTRADLRGLLESMT